MSAEYTSAEENKAVAYHFFENLSSQGKTDVADEFIAPSYVGRTTHFPDIQGPDGYKEFVAKTLTVYPDFQFTVEDMIAAEEDKVVARWILLGTYLAQYKIDQAFNGKPVTMTGITILRIVNGKVEESWTNFDLLSMMQRWGPTPDLLGITNPAELEEISVLTRRGDGGYEVLPLPAPTGTVSWGWPTRW